MDWPSVNRIVNTIAAKTPSLPPWSLHYINIFLLDFRKAQVSADTLTRHVCCPAFNDRHRCWVLCSRIAPRPINWTVRTVCRQRWHSCDRRIVFIRWQKNPYSGVPSEGKAMNWPRVTGSNEKPCRQTTAVCFVFFTGGFERVGLRMDNEKRLFQQ